MHSSISQEDQNHLLRNLATTPGTGAAGGFVAAALGCFKHAKIVNGMDYICSLIDLES